MEEESNFEREEISFINKIYGSSSAFYAFTCALVGVTILAGCLFNVLLRRYCRINICRGAHQRRPRGNDILGDEQLAAQVGLQFELDEAERNRKKMERRQERLIKYQRILQNFKMVRQFSLMWLFGLTNYYDPYCISYYFYLITIAIFLNTDCQ
jgi:hypothetical protein